MTKRPDPPRRKHTAESTIQSDIITNPTLTPRFVSHDSDLYPVYFNQLKYNTFLHRVSFTPTEPNTEHTIHPSRKPTKQTTTTTTTAEPNPEPKRTKMPPTKQEISLLINPLVPEAVQHNNRILSNLRSITSFLLGLTAGILALQSATGFIFYLAGTVVVSGVFHIFLLYRSNGQGAGVFFPGPNVGEVEGIDAKGLVWGAGRE
ncbi:hypothetical protein BBP40_000843, partial [Aspergillus hancockii]